MFTLKLLKNLYSYNLFVEAVILKLDCIELYVRKFILIIESTLVHTNNSGEYEHSY